MTTPPSQKPGSLDEILAVLDLVQVDENTFTGTSVLQPHGRIYGGQVLAQALLAAGRTVDPGRLPHSVHGYFLRPGELEEPITFAVERMRDGRSFSARRTHALQHGKPILSMSTSFQEQQDGIDHSEAMPDVPPPEALPSSVAWFDALDHPVAHFFSRNGAFDMRHVDGDLFTRPAAKPKDAQRLWIRSRSAVPGGQLRQRAMLVYACDQVMLEPVKRRHGISWATENLSVASLDHAMWWHRPVDMGEWLLYSQTSPSASGGRGLALARVFDRAGELVATIAQEGMLRVRETHGT